MAARARGIEFLSYQRQPFTDGLLGTQLAVCFGLAFLPLYLIGIAFIVAEVVCLKPRL